MGENFVPTAADVTIVLPTRGRRDLVAARLRELQHRPILLVIDQGRRAEDLPAELPPGVTVLEVAPRRGTPSVLDAGIRAVTTRFFVHLCDDMIVGPSFITELCATYRQELSPRAGVVAANNGEEMYFQACVGLMPVQFYLAHVDGTAYERYYIDTEWSFKAKWFGAYAVCPAAKFEHFFADGQDAAAMARDRIIFGQRMAAFRATAPPAVDWVPPAPPTKSPAPPPGVIPGKIFLGLPVYHSVEAGFCRSLMQLIADSPVNLTLRMCVGDSLVSRARNTLTADFLASDCEWLMFIDTDLIFSLKHFSQVAGRTQEIVGGLYPKKNEGPLEYIVNSHYEPRPVQPDGLQEMRYVGTGFMKIHRRVFERMIERYGDQLRFAPDNALETVQHDFWSVGVYQYPDGKRRYLSEDWYFCQRAIDCGFRVWADTKVQLQHVGIAVYPLKSQLSALFQPVAPAAAESVGNGVLAPTAPAQSLDSA